MAKLYLDPDLNVESVCSFLHTQLGGEKFAVVEGTEKVQVWDVLCDRNQGQGMLQLFEPKATDEQLLCVVESTGRHLFVPEFESWCLAKSMQSRLPPRRSFTEQRSMDGFVQGVERIREQQLEPMWKQLRKAGEKLVRLGAEVTECESQVKAGLERTRKHREELGQWRPDWELNVTVGVVDEQPVLVIRWNAWSPYHEVLPVEICINKSHSIHLTLFQRLSLVPLTLNGQVPNNQVIFYSLEKTKLSRPLVLQQSRLPQSLPPYPGLEKFEEVQTCISEVLQEVGVGLHCQGAELVRKKVIETGARGEALWRYLVQK